MTENGTGTLPTNVPDNDKKINEFNPAVAGTLSKFANDCIKFKECRHTTCSDCPSMITAMNKIVKLLSNSYQRGREEMGRDLIKKLKDLQYEADQKTDSAIFGLIVAERVIKETK